MRATLIFGSGEAFDNNYSIYGLGAAYYIQDGLEAGLDIEDWTGASPHIMRISPEMRYILSVTPEFRPYAGLFYRHAFVSGRTGIDSFGLRAGLNFVLSERGYLGVGIVAEAATNCSGYCRETYPEFLVGFTF